jgi:hypothetical protein
VYKLQSFERKCLVTSCQPRLSESSVMPLKAQPCYTHTHTHIHTHVHTRTHTHTCIHVHIYTYTYMYTCTHIHTYTHVHTYHKHTHTYTYTHTVTWTCLWVGLSADVQGSSCDFIDFESRQEKDNYREYYRTGLQVEAVLMHHCQL